MPNRNPEMTRDDVIRRLIQRPDPLIVDVGANEGQSIEHFLKIFERPRIFGFEPVPALAERLSEKYTDRENVTIIRQAVSSQVGSSAFHVNDSSPTSSLHPLSEHGVYRTVSHYRTEQIITVGTTTMDAFCADHGIERIDFLKIDAQAHSAEILRGAAGSLERKVIAVLQVEILFHPLYERTESFYELDRLLYPHDYRLYTLLHTDTDGIGEFAYDSKTGEIWYVDAIYICEQALMTPEPLPPSSGR